MSVLDLNRQLMDLARKYAQVARQQLGDRLVSVALFGSVLRGEAGPASDIDILVVLENPPTGMFRRRSLLEPVRQALTPVLEELWTRGLLVDFCEVIRSREEARRFHPLYLDMVDRVMLLYDRDRFLEQVLAAFRRRLEALGARRGSHAGVIYWDLKPDFRPGDVIEL